MPRSRWQSSSAAPKTRVTLTGRLDADGNACAAGSTPCVRCCRRRRGSVAAAARGAGAQRRRHEHGELPSAAQMVGCVSEAARGLDFVGFHAAGPVLRAFADSQGTRHWHHVELPPSGASITRADKAVKSSYAGSQWRDAEFARRVAEGAQLAPIARPPRQLAPGDTAPGSRRRRWPNCSPRWAGAASAWKARRTGTSTLMRLAQRDAALSPQFNLFEHTAEQRAGFTAEGFARRRVSA